MALTAEQRTIIKATVPVLAEHGTTITTRFYQNMLRENPELNNIFNSVHQKTGHQPRALAMSLFAYASNIDDPSKLASLLELVCHKHASLYIRPEHYDIVGTYLLAAMGEILGDALTPEILEAWTAAYGQLAGLMIGREAQLYGDAGDWKDWREFRIARKEPESDDITSFYLEPLDGAPLPAFLPGQYISVQLQLPGHQFKQARQYSLSDAPNPKYFRISVKREDGVVAQDPGYISNLLHQNREVGDTVSVSAPYGDFFFKPSTPEDTPVVLISAGVGLTCLLAILNTLTAKPSRRPISWIHGARSSRSRAFGSHIRSLAAKHENLHTVFFASSPAGDEVQGQDFDHEGRIELSDLDKVKSLRLRNPATQYYVCGPEQFMESTRKALRNLGVDEANVHMELFGTSGVPVA